jgi:7,8-dihydropterin-6-yl-methyl-4-(beta-D-ribofuranosyl)aminobenzene 5'-phosphate synthase
MTMSSDRSSSGNGVRRRDVLCAGGAGALATIIHALLGGGEAARAEGIAGSVPEVDSLTVSVVTDNYEFAIARDPDVPGVEVRHFGWGIAPGRPPDRALVSEFGLSLHAESQRGRETRRVLVDFGFTPQALNNNIDLLGVEPSKLNALVLSHGHYDHFGGLVGFLRSNTGRIETGLPFYVGGEDCFCSREWVGPPERNFGVLDRIALRKARLSVTYAPGPALLAGHGFSTGKVALRSFEKPLAPTSMRVGVDHGLGCFADRLPKEERTKIWVPDQFRHEIATCFNVKNRGLVVLTSCSHRGVINTLQQAQAVSGIGKIHAVIGGFHLAPYPEEYVRSTIAALKSMDVEHVIPLHCTGEVFYEMAKAEIPDRLIRAYTGTRLTFGMSQQRA